MYASISSHIHYQGGGVLINLVSCTKAGGSIIIIIIATHSVGYNFINSVVRLMQVQLPYHS